MDRERNRSFNDPHNENENADGNENDNETYYLHYYSLRRLLL